MAQPVPATAVWTVADLAELFGPIPAYRVRHKPPPGTATEQDVLDIEARENRLCELVEGVLVEKMAGFYESYLACLLIQRIGRFLDENDQGIVTGEAGMMRLSPGLVRIPDVAFISWDRLPGRQVPRQPIPDLVPDLAVEVLSEGNTEKEMLRKLADYFAAGVRLVWYIDPRSRTVRVYTATTTSTLVRQNETLDGGAVLPGFALSLPEFFA